MPAHDLIGRIPGPLEVEESWLVPGTHYARTAEAWKERLDAHRTAALAALRKDLSPPEARLQLERWRLFFLACAELFGFARGRSGWSRTTAFAPGREPPVKIAVVGSGVSGLVASHLLSPPPRRRAVRGRRAHRRPRAHGGGGRWQREHGRRHRLHRLQPKDLPELPSPAGAPRRRLAGERNELRGPEREARLSSTPGAACSASTPSPGTSSRHASTGWWPTSSASSARRTNSSARARRWSSSPGLRHTATRRRSSRITSCPWWARSGPRAARV